MNQESISTHEEQTESQEHIDEMVAKSDELDRLNDPSQGDRPDWLPEKFKNAEQMAEAYGHLEKKLGGESVEEGVEPEAAPEPTPQQEASDVKEAVENAGVDFDSLQAEYNEQGQRSEDA